MFSMKSLPRLSRRVTSKSTEDFRSNEQGPGAGRQETKNPKTRTSAGTQLSPDCSGIFNHLRKMRKDLVEVTKSGIMKLVCVLQEARGHDQEKKPVLSCTSLLLSLDVGQGG